MIHPSIHPPPHPRRLAFIPHGTQMIEGRIARPQTDRQTLLPSFRCMNSTFSNDLLAGASPVRMLVHSSLGKYRLSVALPRSDGEGTARQ